MSAIRRMVQGTGGGPSIVPALSVLKDIVAALIEGPLTGVWRGPELVTVADVGLEILYLYMIEAHNKL